jgi:integrase/recombinase XerD
MQYKYQKQTRTLPMPQILTVEEFLQLSEACTPSQEDGPFMEHVTACHRAILWLFYDTGIRASELLNLCLEDVDRTQGLITVKGKCINQRRIALGRTCLHHLLMYLDEHRSSLAAIMTPELPSKDHLFLSEKGQPMNKWDIFLLLVSLEKRAGITGKSLRPSVLRATFTVRYLELGHDPLSLRYCLGKVSREKIQYYMQMSETSSRSTPPPESWDNPVPGNQLEPRFQRRRGFQVKE